MSETRASRAGGRILVDALRLHGVDRLFCVPGESYLDVLDALYDTPQISVVVAKHEGAAANMRQPSCPATSARSRLSLLHQQRLRRHVHRQNEAAASVYRRRLRP